MKKLPNYIRFFTFIISILFFAVSCDQDPLEDVNLIVNLDISEAAYSFTFIDAVTGEPIGLDNDDLRVDVTVTGKSSDDIIDIGGPEGPTFKATDGFLALSAAPLTNISSTEPIDFNVVAHAKGYISTSVTVYAEEAQKETFFVSMVNIANPPEGVQIEVDENGALASGGVVKETVEIQTQRAGRGGSAHLTIPKDVVMKDKDGNPLRGALTATVGYFSHLDETSMEAFPGGMIARVNDNGSQEDVTFISAGFVAVEIEDARGNKAKTFENGTLDLTIEIPTETINPETGGPVQEGEIIPLWSYDEETAEWTNEGDVIIKGINANGMYEATGKLEHLSYWNWDWKYGNMCFQGGELCFTSNVLPNGSPISGILSAYCVQTGQLLKRSGVWSRIGDCLTFVRVPRNKPVRIVLQQNWVVVGEVFIDNLCAGRHNLNVGAIGGGGAAKFDMTISISGFCASQPNTLLRPSFGFWYRNVTKGEAWSAAWLTNGSITVPNVCIGDVYAAGVYYDGVWYEQQRLISSDDDIILDNLTFTRDMCQFLGF